MEPTRVLVVDDEKNARTALAELLEDEGYDVAMAGDGVEALETASSFHPHVILCDVKMPRMDGVHLREALAAQPSPPVVVLMSAYPRATADDLFVSKPIGMTQLYRAIAAASIRARAA